MRCRLKQSNDVPVRDEWLAADMFEGLFVLGTVKLTIWKRYFIAVGIVLSISIVLSVFLMQGKERIARIDETLIFLID